MSTFLKLKRSSTSPTATPGNLRNGEPAYSYGAGTYPDKVQAGGGSSVVAAVNCSSVKAPRTQAVMLQTSM